MSHAPANLILVSALLLGACSLSPGDDVNPSSVTPEMLYGFWVNDQDGVRTVFQFVAEDDYYEETRGKKDLSFVFRGSVLQLASTFSVSGGMLAETVLADPGGSMTPGKQLETKILRFRFEDELVIESTRNESGESVYKFSPTCPKSVNEQGWSNIHMKPGYQTNYFDGFDAVAVDAAGEVHAIASNTGSRGVGNASTPNPAFYVSTANTCGVRSYAIPGFPYRPRLRVGAGAVHAVWNDVNGQMTYATKPMASEAFAFEELRKVPGSSVQPLLELFDDGRPVVAFVGQPVVMWKDGESWSEVELAKGGKPATVTELARHPSGSVWIAASANVFFELKADGTLVEQEFEVAPPANKNFFLDKNGEPGFIRVAGSYSYGQYVATSFLELVRRQGGEWTTLELGQGVDPVVTRDAEGRVVVVSRWDNYRNSNVPNVAVVDGDTVSRWFPLGFAPNPMSSDKWDWSQLDVAAGADGVIAITGGDSAKVMVRPPDELFSVAPGKLSIAFEGDGAGSVTVGDKSCSANCEVELPIGSYAEVLATPDDSSELYSFSGCLPSKPGFCHITASGMTSVKVHFRR